MIDADRLRSLFLAFFAERGHTILPSASLNPGGDPRCCSPPPACTRSCRTCSADPTPPAASSPTARRYFKRESITWSHELLTRDDLLAIAPQRLWISVFAGNQATPADAESAGVWRDLGIPAERIVYLGEEHNWWTLGPEGPCGPDTEVFVDTTDAACQRGDAGCLPGTCDCGRFVEVWNNVFMAFQRRGGQLLPLPQANVDIGMGLERMLTVLNGAASLYQTAPLDAIHDRIASRSPTGADELTSHPELVRALRVLTDHLRSAVFNLGDPNGVLPSNQGRGSVLRRATAKLRREIARLRAQDGDRIPAEVAFHLYDTDGLPIEVTSEIAREAGFSLDVDGFERSSTSTGRAHDPAAPFASTAQRAPRPRRPCPACRR
jgi:alanyl-tRNA synthetase